MSNVKKIKGEDLVNKSAAEFFSEHQQIAGFDNHGKSLFTTIRELVENSLDAAEAINVLPDISVEIIERTRTEHNILHGIHHNHHSSSSSSSVLNSPNAESNLQFPSNVAVAINAITTTATTAAAATTNKTDWKEQMYYTIKVKDNGSGIASENIGNMLGRVLSGSKHSIRQTRGKFGLGAKMALIWSKKSSGLPIEVVTAYSTNSFKPPSDVVHVVLDIDIYKNSPNIISQSSLSNTQEWRGTEITLTVGGTWSTCRSKMLQYFQQLAVITPYAQINFSFICQRDDKKSIQLSFERRSDAMPPVPSEMLPHPKSLNHITMTNLLKQSKSNNLLKFLTKDLCGISISSANTIISSIDGLSEDSIPSDIPANKISALCQAFYSSDNTLIKSPSATGLSPAGAYNMRLGVLKELQPKLVATFIDKPSSHEGHPFIVEGAVSVGGSQIREGINVYRFANRIPLLFETGADVVTQVATKRINWSSYHIDQKKDNIGVFISIVSTKIPFKGTSKEYIGDDILEIQQSVKRVIQGCCQQLRTGLAKSIALREEQERKKTLVKYIPDISRSLSSILSNIASKRSVSDVDDISSFSSSFLHSSSSSSSSINYDLNENQNKRQRLIREVTDSLITEETISSKLLVAVDRHDASLMQASLSTTMDKNNLGIGGFGDSNQNNIFVYLLPVTTPLDFPVPKWKEVVGAVSLPIHSVSQDSMDYLSHDQLPPIDTRLSILENQRDENDMEEISYFTDPAIITSTCTPTAVSLIGNLSSHSSSFSRKSMSGIIVPSILPSPTSSNSDSSRRMSPKGQKMVSYQPIISSNNWMKVDCKTPIMIFIPSFQNIPTSSDIITRPSVV